MEWISHNEPDVLSVGLHLINNTGHPPPVPTAEAANTNAAAGSRHGRNASR